MSDNKAITFKHKHMAIWPLTTVILGFFAGGETKDFAAVGVAAFIGCMTAIYAWQSAQKENR